MVPGRDEEQHEQFPEPGCQEDPVLATKDVAQVAEDVRVACSLEADAQAREHEEDVRQDVDLIWSNEQFNQMGSGRG